LIYYPYDSIKTLPKHEGILYPDNIKVICHDLFAEFIGLQADALENYEQIIDLNYNGDVSTLKSIHHTKFENLCLNTFKYQYHQIKNKRNCLDDVNS